MAGRVDGSRRGRCRACGLSSVGRQLPAACRGWPFVMSRLAFQKCQNPRCRGQQANHHMWPEPIRSRRRRAPHRRTLRSASSRLCKHECDDGSPSACQPRKQTVFPKRMSRRRRLDSFLPHTVILGRPAGGGKPRGKMARLGRMAVSTDFPGIAGAHGRLRPVSRFRQQIEGLRASDQPAA